MNPIARLPDGRIITKDGKPSCSCCDTGPCNPDGSSKSGEHVFDENGLYLCGPGFDTPSFSAVNYHDISNSHNNHNSQTWLANDGFPANWSGWLACFLSPGGYDRFNTADGGIFFVRPQSDNPPKWWDTIYTVSDDGFLYSHFDNDITFKATITTELWVGYSPVDNSISYPWLRSDGSIPNFIPHKKIKTITTTFGENSAFPGFYLEVEDLATSLGALTAHLAVRWRFEDILPSMPPMPFPGVFNFSPADYGISGIPSDHRITEIRFTARMLAIGFYRVGQAFPPIRPTVNHFVMKISPI